MHGTSAPGTYANIVEQMRFTRRQSKINHDICVFNLSEPWLHFVLPPNVLPITNQPRPDEAPKHTFNLISCLFHVICHHQQGIATRPKRKTATQRHGKNVSVTLRERIPSNSPTIRPWTKKQCSFVRIHRIPKSWKPKLISYLLRKRAKWMRAAIWIHYPKRYVVQFEQIPESKCYNIE